MNLTEHLHHEDIPDIQRPERIIAGLSTVVVACFADPGVVLLDARSMAARGRIELDWQTEGAGASSRCPAGDVAVTRDRLFLGQAFSNFVIVADEHTHEIVARLPLGGEGKFAASPDGRTVYFANNIRHEFNGIGVGPRFSLSLL